MDVDSTGGSGHYLRVATFSSQVLLHQTEVDIERVVYSGVEDCKIKTDEGHDWRRGHQKTRHIYYTVT